MASAVSSLFGSNTNTGQTSPSQTQSANASALSNASNEQMFLQLLVSQLKNQDPTNPVDGTQFVSELSQFSQVEQLIAIRTDIEGAGAKNPNTSAAGNPAAGTPASGTTPGSTTPSSSTSGTNPTGTTN